jgi:hypothetical protein
MNKLGHSVAIGTVLLVAATSAQAQIRQGTRTGTTSPIGSVGTRGTIYPTANIPPGQMPPAGMCRIWIDGVPPGRQPAPTDCTTAQRNVPANGRVIYGSGTQPSYPNRNYPAGTVHNGRYDPRLDPRSPQYDPRLDPRSSQYDPRLDPYRTNTGTYGSRTARDQARWERERQQRAIEQARLERERQWREQQRSQKEQLKYQQKEQKEREKEWKKEHKGDKGHGNGNDHDDDDRGRRH